MHQKFLLPILFLLVQNVYSIDLQITGKEVDLYLTPEYNRSLDFCWALSTVGVIQLNEQHTVKAGLALGGAGDAFDIKVFTSGEIAIPVNFPFYVSFAYNYSGLPGYETHAHSIVPLVSFKWQRAGFSVGPNFRFTSFLGESTVFEPMPTIAVYVNIINNDSLQLGLKMANFDDFTYGNIGSYFLNIYSVVYIDTKLSLINELELRQSGSIGLASNFYGFVYRGGVTILW